MIREEQRNGKSEKGIGKQCDKEQVKGDVSVVDALGILMNPVPDTSELTH